MSAEQGAGRLPGDDTASWSAMLRVKPVRNQGARLEEVGDTLRIFVHRAYPWWYVPPLSWIFAMRPERVLALDRIGTQLFRWCDGEQTVEELIDRLSEEQGLSFHEARSAATGYLRELVLRGALVGTAPKEETAGRTEESST